MRAKRPVTFVSWRLYFQSFCEKHGQPITHPDERRLIFPDGWTYSARSHKGPEWAPPADPKERFELVRMYWRLRRVGILRELARARGELMAVKEAVASRSAELTVVTMMSDEEGQVERFERPLDPAEFQAAVEELKTELAEADSELVDVDLELKLLRMPTPERGTPSGEEHRSEGAAS